jgi:hypothetical protein
MKNSFNWYLLVSFGIILGTVVIATVAFYFLIGDITSRSSAISADRTLVANQNNSLATFAEIEQDSVEAAEYKTAMDKLLPAQNELIDFPQWLQNVAATYNVTVNFSFTADTVPATPTNPGTIGFSLTAEGGNNDVISFLKDLESQAPGFLLSFNSFNLTQNGGPLNVVIGGNMFFR